jgi:hypothetical protein
MLPHIKRVHVVYQPLWKMQVTIACRLDAPHYQAASLQIQDSNFQSFTFNQEDKSSHQHPSL